MRKFLLSLFIFITTQSVKGQIVNIPDANFKNALLTHNPVIDLNADGQIQVSEAAAFTGTMNVGHKNIADLTGINAFTSLGALICYYNQVTALNVNGLTSLSSLNCSANQISTLTINNLPSLQILFCGSNRLTNLPLSNLPQLQQLMCGQNKFTSLSLSGLPSVKSINIQACDSLAALDLSNLTGLRFLNCSQCNLSTLNMSGLTSLDTLYCMNNKLTSITLSNPAVLKNLSASNNKLSALPAGLSALKILDVSNNMISVFNLDNLNSLISVGMSNNLCTSLALNNKLQLQTIYCENNQISNLQLSNLSSLRTLYCFQNQIASLTLNGFPSLENVRCFNNRLASLTLTGTPKMKDFMCGNNMLTALSLSNMPLLQWIQCQNNQLTSLSLSNLPELYELFCDNNQLSSLPFLNSASLPKLRSITFSGNSVPRLIVENHPILEQIIAINNPLDSLRLKNCPQLSWLSIEKTPLASLKLDSLPRLRVLNCGKSDSLRSISLNLPALEQFNCDSSGIITADLSQTKVIQCVVPGNPLMQNINLRNNALNYFSYPYNFSNNPSLRFICVDDGEVARITDSVLSQLPGQGVTVSTVCNYIPAISSTIRGTVRFDLYTNACNNGATAMTNVKLNNLDGTYLKSAFTNNTGQYVFHTLANADTVITAFQQPSWFNVSPPIHTLNIPNPGVTITADFCVTPNGKHSDLDIVLIPLDRPRPGFDANYKLVYRNKGNQILSGTAYLLFNNNKMNLISSSPAAVQQPPGTLSWPYVDLLPFETKTVNLKFHVNTPPVVNQGDTLLFIANIPVPGDETPEDNQFIFRQAVVNSFDPNDKLVTEGPQISISKLDEYLHYVVRFQNTGTADAIKITVRDSLSGNLDWGSFEPIIASHPYRAVITKGYLAEFIFDGINLPPKIVNEPASNGFISFKIKPKSNLVVGDSIQNTASIYFDFNAPIITNTVSTKIYKPVSNNPLGLTVYSNPAKNLLSFSVRSGVEITAINLYNSMGQKMGLKIMESTATTRKIDVSHFTSGVYFLELITNSGKASEKIMIAN